MAAAEAAYAQRLLRRFTKGEFELSPRYRAFQKTYFNDPVAFAHDCIDFRRGDGPTEYQDEIMGNLITYGREAARGMHGLGKSALSSWLIHWFALTRDGTYDWKNPTTASSWTQLTKFLWPEVHKWAAWLRWDLIGRDPYLRGKELLMMSIKLQTGESFAIASDNPAMIEGAHATQLFYMYDEAKSISSAFFDATEGAFSNVGIDEDQQALALAVSTPGEPSGRFYEIHAKRPGTEDWHATHIVKERVIAAGRVTARWVLQRAAQWGEKSSVYLNRVEGEFAQSGEDTVIPLAYITAAIERGRAVDWQGTGLEVALGVDVARKGEDLTTIARVRGNVCEYIAEYGQQDTMVTVGKVIEHLRKGDNMQVPVGVDVIGLGAGVYDRLAEQGYNVYDVNVSSADDIGDTTGLLRFVNLRSSLWWMLRERLDPKSASPLALPNIDRLVTDLAAPRWSVTSTGAIKVESKEDIRKRTGYSTDFADSLALALYVMRSGTLTVVSGGGESIANWR